MKQWLVEAGAGVLHPILQIKVRNTKAILCGEEREGDEELYLRSY